MRFERHLEIDESEATAVDVLSESTELSRGGVKQAMSKGAVWLSHGSHTQRLRRADKALKPGDRLHIYYDEDVLKQQAADALLIADQGSYSIWYKPYGMFSQGSKWGDHCTINRWVEKHLQPQRPAFITHRLDRAATGLMIIAHQKKVAAYFAGQFRARAIEKKYQAIVHGRFPDSQTIDTAIDQKPALSHVKKLSYDAARDQTLVEVEIETGRKHQIRRHLAEAGFPIVGDRLYGHPGDDHDDNLHLTSCHLAFVSPDDRSQQSYTLPEALRPAFSKP